ncbi:hypothetical protein K445DRAFT_370755 [Daldinia sp. EC12]|nr:hypothetical protein K445DRAFT_370755 [Daldinia sp. EC12]
MNLINKPEVHGDDPFIERRPASVKFWQSREGKNSDANELFKLRISRDPTIQALAELSSSIIATTEKIEREIQQYQSYLASGRDNHASELRGRVKTLIAEVEIEKSRFDKLSEDAQGVERMITSLCNKSAPMHLGKEHPTLGNGKSRSQKQTHITSEGTTMACGLNLPESKALPPLFRCWTCVGDCRGTQVGFDTTDNDHLVNLENLNVSITNRFPIYDKNGRLHSITLRKEIISQIIAPAAPACHTAFQWLQEIFFRQSATRSWHEFDMEMGVKFKHVDNIHILSPSLIKYNSIVGQDGESRQDLIKRSSRVELIGIRGGVKRTYRYFVPRFRVGTALDRVLNGKRSAEIGTDRLKILRTTLGSFPPPPTGHYWKLSDQKYIYRLFAEERKSSLALPEVLQIIANRYRELPGCEKTETWAVFEFFLAYNRKTFKASGDLPRLSLALRHYELPAAKEAMFDLLRVFPDWNNLDKPGSFVHFYKLTAYRAYLLGKYTKTPVSFATWTDEMDFNLPAMRNPVSLGSPGQGRRWQHKLHLDRFIAACEAMLHQGYTISQIYDGCRQVRLGSCPKHTTPPLVMQLHQLMGSEENRPPLRRMVGMVYRMWRGGKYPNDPLAIYLKGKQQDEGVTAQESTIHRQEEIEREYSPPTALFTYEPPRKPSNSNLAVWIDGQDWSDMVKRASRQGPHINSKLLTRAPVLRSVNEHRTLVEMLAAHLALFLEKHERASLGLLDPSWKSVKAQLLSSQRGPDDPQIIFLDVEAVIRPVGMRVLSFHMMKINAPRCNPVLAPCMEGHIFATIDHRMTVYEAVQDAISFFPQIKYAIRQYSVSHLHQPTHGICEADVADKLEEFGITKDRQQHDLMISYTLDNGNVWDRNGLAALPNCERLLPRFLTPVSLLAPLGWSGRCKLLLLFEALTRNEEDLEQRKYNKLLAKHCHLPWVDNEMTRIVTRKLLLDYYKDA